MNELKVLESEKFIINYKSYEGIYKLFQIVFNKKDGSIFINFPYYKHTNGLVSLVTLKANTTYPTSAKLIPGGKITSHLVKYSHHPDGISHFSQDGKVFTRVKKQSIPFNKMHGHIFTIMLQGFNDFAAIKSSREIVVNKFRTYISISSKTKEIYALKFVGRFYKKSKLKSQIVGSVKGPIVPCQTNEGKKNLGFLISHPFEDRINSNILLLTCEEVPKIDPKNYSALTFIGGFDSLDIAYDHNKDTQFLALSYPVENYDELKNIVESIDYSV